MKRKLMLSLVALALALGGALPEAAASDLCSDGMCEDTVESTEPEIAYVSNEILIKLRPEAAGTLTDRQSPAAHDTGLGSVDRLNRDHNAVRMEKVGKEGRKTKKDPGLFRWYKITLPGEREVVREGLGGPAGRLEGILAGYQADPHVEYAQPNFVYEPDVTPDDPLFPEQYSHSKTQAELGWDIETGDPEVTIAVIGTGVYWQHEDLIPNIWTNADEIADNREDDDGNGYIDDVRGWNFEDGSNEIADRSGHETKVAGVAAARTDNALGVTGVCWQCTIMPLVVSYTSEDVKSALDYATDNDADIVNMSFSNSASDKYGPDSIVKESVDRAHAENLVLIATAGNEGNEYVRYPSGLDNVMAITATDSSDHKASYSSYGPWVDVAAPGSAILTTNRDGDYDSISSGTSFSAPYVAGLAGLILSRNRALGNDTVRLIIDYTADKIDSDLFIGGRVNVYEALQQDDVPQLYAIIKSPYNNSWASGDILEIYGTALGDSYVVEYKPSASDIWIQLGSGPQTIDGVLATLDTAPLDDGAYDIRVESFKGASSDSDTIQISLVKNLQEGWPVSVASDGVIVTASAYADIDDDGDLEIFLGAGGATFGFHHDGTPVDGWPQNTGPLVFAGPTIADIDNDGDLEIISASWRTGYVFAWHHDGSPVQGWPQPTTGEHLRTSVVASDLDNDGYMELIAGSNGVYVWNHDGSLEVGWPVLLDNNQASPAVGDLDGDGDKEIVVPAWQNTYAFHHRGTPVDGWPRSYGSHTPPVIGDVDKDGSVEIVLGRSYVSYVVSGDGSGLASLGAGVSYSRFALGDIDLDDDLEILVSSNLDGVVYAFHHDGSSVSGWPRELPFVPYTGQSGIALADVDGDADIEVIVAADDKLLYAFHDDGSLVEGWPLPLGGYVYSTPAVADIDNDGDVEVMIGTVAGDFFVWDLPGAYDRSGAPWPVFQYDAQHTGCFECFCVLAQDSDCDGLPNGSDPCVDDPDCDDDGCGDGEEVAMGYDPVAWYDFYDVPVPANPDPTPNGGRNQAVGLQDVLALVSYIAASRTCPAETTCGEALPSNSPACCADNPNSNGMDYDMDKDGDTVADGRDYDRSPGGKPNPPWDAGPPNGAVTIGDVLAVLAQVGLDCSGPP